MFHDVLDDMNVCPHVDLMITKQCMEDDVPCRMVALDVAITHCQSWLFTHRFAAQIDHFREICIVEHARPEDKGSETAYLHIRKLI
jgi:hypothetical protein